MYSVDLEKAYDCAGDDPCTKQAFPPPNGHWGTPNKIWREDD